MTNKIQILSINLLNTKYKFIFNLFVCCFIYALFYSDVLFCMNENSLPAIAEAKPIQNTTRSIIQREVSAFVGSSETIEAQKLLIQEQQKIISDYKKEIDFNQEMLHLIAGNDHIADAISDRGLDSYINEVCEKHGKPLWYPWIEDPDQYKKN
jgi:hypothetical protein